MFSYRIHNREAKRYIGDEDTVHDINMKPIRLTFGLPICMSRSNFAKSAASMDGAIKWFVGIMFFLER